MASLRLGYADLQAVNPRLVMVSITAFGQDGPYADYQASDIVGMALGGFMHLTGDGDRPPLRVSMPQFYQHGSAAGAAAAMIAHTHRQLTGQGQHVDVSCQQAVARTLAHAPQYWDLEQTILRRMGAYRESAGGTYTRINWPCKDGYVNFQPGGGTAGSARSVRALLEWMTEEGMGSPELDAVNWEELGYGTARAEIMEQTVAAVAPFFMTHTRNELADGASGAAHPAVPRSHAVRHPGAPPTGRPRLLRPNPARGHRRNRHLPRPLRQGYAGRQPSRHPPPRPPRRRAQPRNPVRRVGAERP